MEAAPVYAGGVAEPEATVPLALAAELVAALTWILLAFDTLEVARAVDSGVQAPVPA